jgi:Uma2 family endonuclease
MGPLLKRPEIMTADEFKAWSGDDRGGKYELVDGELRAMSPASATHGAIQSRLGRMIGNHLDGTGNRCQVYTEPAVDVRTRAAINTRIPDLGVSCAKLTALDMSLPDPILLIEILSPGNKADTWANVWAYCTIPTVQEIVVLASTRIEADVLRRDADGNWPANPTRVGPDGILALASIGFSALLRDMYVGTYIVDVS